MRKTEKTCETHPPGIVLRCRGMFWGGQLRQQQDAPTQSSGPTFHLFCTVKVFDLDPILAQRWKSRSFKENVENSSQFL